MIGNIYKLFLCLVIPAKAGIQGLSELHRIFTLLVLFTRIRPPPIISFTNPDSLAIRELYTRYNLYFFKNRVCEGDDATLGVRFPHARFTGTS